MGISCKKTKVYKRNKILSKINDNSFYFQKQRKYIKSSYLKTIQFNFHYCSTLGHLVQDYTSPKSSSVSNLVQGPIIKTYTGKNFRIFKTFIEFFKFDQNMVLKFKSK